VFDAVNGIERRYAPIHVGPNADPGASRRAAAVQTAYATLVKIYPAQKTDLDGKLAASLAAIASGDAAENSVSTQRGLEWGQTVADAIWAWRLTDGITPPPPPYVGGYAPGQWRPTPPAFAPGGGNAVRIHDAVGDRIAFAVSSCRSARTRERPLCNRFQRNQTHGKKRLREPNYRPDVVCEILEFSDGRFFLG
jgi:hypothetical protein